MAECTRCGRGPLEYNKAAGLYYARDGGPPGANCEDHHFPAWRHTPDPLTKRQARAVELAKERGETNLFDKEAPMA